MPLGDGAVSNAGRMLRVAVAAELIYQLVGANMSSPQTAELNAKARAPTISKWVNLTNVEAVGWTLFLCALDESLWPALGASLAAVSMWFKYKYAISAGLSAGGQPTEDYSGHG